MRRTSTILLTVLLLAPAAYAQDGQAPEPQAPQQGAAQDPSSNETPPTGAGNGAGGAASPLPAGHPPVANGSPHSGLAGVLAPPELARADASDDVRPGAIRVTVVDESGQPVAGAAVDVGSLAQGERTRHNARTDRDGVAVFEGLDTGTTQAYRVNVPYLGATYSTSPFQLPTDRGYDVRITRLPVTHDDRFVFFHIFRVIVELKDQRLHVIHQVELTNAGQETYVFPASGLRARLPEGATFFQAQRSMTDQRVEELPNSGGYALHGSLPPGTVQLAWAYDVPVNDRTMRIPVDVPMRFFGLQVLSEAPPGLVMDVAGMPDPQRVDNEGQPLWITQMRRGPADPPLERITLTVSGIPGPGPGRWIAVVLASMFVLGGIFFFVYRGDDREAAARARARRREELLAEARALEAEFEEGEIGPEFRQKRRAEIVRALAVLLHEEETARERGAKSPPAAKTVGRATTARSAR